MADTAVEAPTAPEHVKSENGADQAASINGNTSNEVKSEEVKMVKDEDTKTEEEPKVSISAHTNSNKSSQRDSRKRKDPPSDDRDWRTRRDEDPPSDDEDSHRRKDRGSRNGDRNGRHNDRKSEPSDNLILKGISHDSTRDSLRQCFEEYGSVSRVNIVEDRETGKRTGTAFVQFDTIADAKAALAGENGQKIDGRNVYIDFAGPKPDSGRGDRGGRGGSRGGRGGRGGSRGGGRPNNNSQDRNSKEYSNNVKTNYEDLPESDDAHAIRKQVEFYFSDSNLMLDKFLFGLVQGTKNVPVPIKQIHSFKRMRHFQPFSVIVDALKDSEFLDVNDKDEVSRKEALGEGVLEDAEANLTVYEDRARPRSAYVKGFGEEGPSTQFDIEEFFAPYGPINAIRLRRQHPEKTFKGSVFVEFDSEDTQKSFLENKDLKWNEKPLKIMSKEEYVFGKAEDIKAGKIKAHGYNDRNRNFDSHRHSGGRRDRADTRRKHSNASNEEKPTTAGTTEEAKPEAAAEENETKAEAENAVMDEAPVGDSKKRAREADGEAVENGDDHEAKKAKVDES